LRAPVSAILCTKRGERLRVRWQSIELIFGPAVLDRHVLTLDIIGVLEAWRNERRRPAFVSGDVGLTPPAPRSRRAAEKCDELAALQLI
jgi:hypothetical protein